MGKVVFLDGKKLKSIDELHRFLKDELEFPDFYGMNLDALWDMLTGWVDLPLTIEWIHLDRSKKFLGEKNTKNLCSVLKDASDEMDEFTFICRNLDLI